MKTKNFTLLIGILSAAIPLTVAFLILVPGAKIHPGFNTRSLPLLNAILNATTALLLLASLYSIRHKNIPLHRRLNLTAVVLSTLFLVSYVLYHASNPSVRYGDLNHDGILSEPERALAGNLRYLYYFILSSHILLSAVIVPLVLFTLLRGLQQQYDRHRRIARITWPLWLYVALSGVAVYLMINPYY